MINYSVYMMGNPLKKNEAPKAYAKNQVSEIWPLEKFSKHIADHNGGYSRGTVKGVLSDMCDCLKEQLLCGNKIQLGELGTFGISLSSEGAKNMEEFSAKNILEVNIIFTPGKDFEDLRSEAEFNLVTSRAIQVAAIKAVKANESSIDLEALKKKGEDSGEKPGETVGGGGTGSDSGSGNESGDDLA